MVPRDPTSPERADLPLPDDVLLRVTKPARYLDGEPHAVHKDHDAVELTVALAYPDVYEVGMSNLGLRLLYQVLNDRPDTVAERVFVPWVDLADELRRLAIPLFALESGLPVRGFDLLGISLQYELTYTNVLELLDLSGIPLLAADRTMEHPLVVGGGPCAFNPEPVAPFFDLFFLGEAEEGIGDIADAYREWRRQAGGDRRRLLADLAQVPGVYVPSFYEVTYDAGGRVAAVTPNHPAAPPSVTKRMVNDLGRFPLPPRPVMPFIETIHDRAVVEVMRGCSRGCRFCQAGMIYRPVRERTADEVVKAARDIIGSTGYEEISLTSLSTCDWGPVAEVVRDLVAEHGPKGTGISLSSLRTDTFAVELASKIQEVRKTGLTFAPEAGTERLRAVINKGVTRQDLLDAAGAAFAAGWDRLKLYYMIGLPTETDDDLVGIAEEAGLVQAVYDQRGQGNMVSRRPLSLTVSLATFVPKAHTPFQWEAQITPDEARRRIAVVREAMAGGGRSSRKRRPSVRLDWHDPVMARIEAVLARGDRRVARAVEAAWRSGARFEGWSEHFRPELWTEAFAAAGIDPSLYAGRERDLDEPLPWGHLSSGLEDRFLRRERERAMDGRATPDCRWEACSACGVCDNLGATTRPGGADVRPDRVDGRHE